MKKLSLFIYILLITCYLQAQDLIVTSSGDSLNCTITKVSKNFIHFTYNHNTEIRNTLIPVDQVVFQQKNYFIESEIPKTYVFNAKYPRLRIAIDGGWQYRLAKLPPGLDPNWYGYYKNLKSGFHYDFQVGYFFAKNHGIEVIFSQHFFSSRLDNMYIIDDEGNIIASGVLKNNIMFNYAGANYYVRIFTSNNKSCFLMNVGLGYLGYIGKDFFSDTELSKTSAATLGVLFGIGYDIGIANNLCLGFNLSLIGGSFRKYNLTIDGKTTSETLPDNTAEGLGTIKLSVGLRFIK